MRSYSFLDINPNYSIGLQNSALSLTVIFFIFVSELKTEPKEKTYQNQTKNEM
jgi:hypothetical protein